MKMFQRYAGFIAALLPLAVAAADYPAKPIRDIAAELQRWVTIARDAGMKPE